MSQIKASESSIRSVSNFLLIETHKEPERERERERGKAWLKSDCGETSRCMQGSWLRGFYLDIDILVSDGACTIETFL